MATLPEEIMFIWRRPKSMSAVLFLVNRYVAVLGNIFVLMSAFLPVSTEVLQCCICIRLTGSLYLYRGFKFTSSISTILLIKDLAVGN
ncbi:uncharacterized protein HD556DRAFT_1413903, partial [Suillus plorans]